MTHAAYYPPFVDDCKSTICRLPKFSDLADYPAMPNEAPYLKIGARLLRLRDAYGAPSSSQREWAESHQFSPTQYNNWEKGTRRIPVDSAERLCDQYGLTLDFLYRGRRDGLSENARKAV